MIPIENEKRYPQKLCKLAREYCEAIGAIEISNIADLGEGDCRVMYWLPKGNTRKMEATILKIK